MRRPDPTFSREITGAAIAEGGADACYTCGLCVAVCPAKRFANEGYDPRKFLRMITLGMKEELLRSELIWLCLLCESCTFHCPRGVKFSHITPLLRDMAIREGYVDVDLLKKVAYEHLIPVRGRMECAAKLFNLYKRSGFKSFVEGLGLRRLLPESLRELDRVISQMPPRPLRKVLPDRVEAEGKRVAKVAYFYGCAFDLLFHEISRATISVLTKNGCDVVIPKDIKCCGMPLMGYTDLDRVRELARHNIAVLEGLGVDFIVTDCATCGSTLKEYKDLLADDPAYAHRALYISEKVRDVSEFLVRELRWGRRPQGEVGAKVTYHDPCHLVRSQGISEEPREVLDGVPGLRFVEMRESDQCCGGAGTYNIFHFEESMRILDRKVEALEESGADAVASGCPGCILQLKLGVRRRGLKVEVFHPVELLNRSYQAS